MKTLYFGVLNLLTITKKKLWLNFSSVMMTIIVTNFIEYIIKVFSKMGGVKYN